MSDAINVFEGREFPAVDDPRWYSLPSEMRYRLGPIQVSATRLWKYELTVDGIVVARGNRVGAYFDAVSSVVDKRGREDREYRRRVALDKGAAVAKGKDY